MKPSSPLRSTHCIPQEKFPRKPYNKSSIDQFYLIKMAGYWPRSFFACLWTLDPYVLTKQALLIKDLLDDIKNTISLGILLGADKVHVTQSCMLTGANHSVGFLASMTEELNSGLQKSRNIFLNTPFHSIHVILLLTRLYMDLCSRTFLVTIMFQLQENQNHTFRPA